MRRFLVFNSLALFVSLLAASAFAADAAGTDYSFSQCTGSLMPYVKPEHPYEYPDSLVPVFINHLGRHGSRYPASSANSIALAKVLDIADSLKTITPLGKQLKTLNDRVIKVSSGRWGALDSLGEAELQGIAQRMFLNFTNVFSRNGTVNAISSYAPRAIKSMHTFVHQLCLLNNQCTFDTSAGRANNPLLRPFESDSNYLDFRRTKTWEPTYEDYFAANCPTSALERVVGARFPFDDSSDERQRIALVEYYVVAGLSAMSIPSQMSVYFTRAEANTLWSCFNLRQYLQRTATTISSIPADIAAELLLNIIETTDNYIRNPETSPCAMLRFGHAETLMPLLSLLHIPGAYYLTNYFDTVAHHWRDFDLVPMAANICFILFQAQGTGNYYVRIDLNERPVALRSGDNTVIFPWPELRTYLMNLIPL